MNCKETGDKVSVAAGMLCWLCVLGTLACACARGYQEVKKHLAKNKAPAVQMMNVGQKIR